MNDIDKEGTKALQHYFASCSVIINSDTPRFEHGSGVAVRYRNENYIVTAAHVLKREPKNENLLIIGKPDSTLKEIAKQEICEAFFNGTYSPIKSSTGTHLTITNRLVDETLGDIAALKVRDFENALPHTIFHDLTNQGQTDISVGRSVVICGFPGELALHAQRKITGKHHIAIFTTYAWQQILTMPGLLDQSAPLDPSIDFVTDFPLNESRDPKGMSGGGAWTIPKTDRGQLLWSPNRTQLIGIQSGFYGTSSLLRLTRIERVLELLLSHQLQ